MAKQSIRKRTTKSKKSEGPVIRPEIIGTGLMILAVITLLSLITPTRGVFISAWLDFLNFFIGWGVYIFWLVLAILAVWFFRSFNSEDRDEKWEKPVGAFLLLGVLIVAFQLISPGTDLVDPGGGGVIGLALGEMLTQALGVAGTIVVLIGTIPILIILISGLSFRELGQRLRDLYYRFQDWRHFRQLTINQPTTRSLPQEPKTRLINRILPIGRSDTNTISTDDGDIPLVIVGSAKEIPPAGRGGQNPQLPAHASAAMARLVRT